MKRARITCGIICLLIDIIICVAVCRQWAQVGCSTWSLIAAIVFYSVGCLAVWITIDDFVKFVYRDEEDEYYKKRKED